MSSFVANISFGCSNLLGAKTPEQGRVLLDAAYDAGIRSFDVARVYNFGDAERLVAQFSASRRAELTIATKFGFMPNANVARLGGIVNIARRVMRSSNFIRKLVKRNVGKITQAGRFDVATARASLEESLRALNTDYIDIFLLHEASAADCTDELFAFLEEARQEGKIRTFGVGSAYPKIPQIAQTAARFIPVVQFDSSPVDRHRLSFEAIRPPENKLAITHGSFTGTDALRDTISAGGADVAAWSRRVGFDLAGPGMFHSALLRCALRANPGGKAVFRASTPERIHQNIRGLDTAFTGDQLDALEALCSETNSREQAPKS